ncbi:MAG TPA: hypothetical protein ENI95_01795 [Chloroflexi bacterium]|nr:hypothetical protein [Chloroflexota bacterium]
MTSDTSPEPARREGPPRATRIREDSATFRWVVPAILIILTAVTIVLILAALAVLFDVFPRG